MQDKHCLTPLDLGLNVMMFQLYIKTYVPCERAGIWRQKLLLSKIDGSEMRTQVSYRCQEGRLPVMTMSSHSGKIGNA